MAKHRFHKTPIQASRYLFLAALVLVLGVSIDGAGQQSASPSARGAQATPARTKSARAPAARKDTGTDASSSSQGAGKRDPFKLPEYGTGKGAVSEGGMESLPAGGVLPAGKRGLIVSQLKLEGVVRQITANKMTALVVDQRKLAYFLHENDSVYNGVVSKITPDSIYFKENVLDSKGHVTTREVVKRLGAAPGEGR
jgi:hypothetical protein